MIEHQVGAYTDCPHREGLAVISVPYYKYIYKDGIDKLSDMQRESEYRHRAYLTKEQAALAWNRGSERIYQGTGLPETLRELGATDDMLSDIAESSVKAEDISRWEKKIS